jgi:hypothetical protein
VPAGGESTLSRIGRLTPELAPRLIKAAGASAIGADGDWAERLVESFAAQLRGAGGHVFLAELGATLRAAGAEDPSAPSWHSVMSTLRAAVVPIVGNECELLALCEDIWHDAAVAITAYAERLQAERRLAEAELLRSIVRMSETVSEARDRTALFDRLAGYLERFDVPSCFIVLYDGPSSGSEARLAFAWADGHRLSAGDRWPRDRLPPLRLFPERRYTFDVEALCHRNAFLGYALFERKPLSPDVSQALRNLMSAALGTIARSGVSESPPSPSVPPSSAATK